jgi:hypothetical protein
VHNILAHCNLLVRFAVLKAKKAKQVSGKAKRQRKTEAYFVEDLRFGATGKQLCYNSSLPVERRDVKWSVSVLKGQEQTKVSVGQLSRCG